MAYLWNLDTIALTTIEEILSFLPFYPDVLNVAKTNKKLLDKIQKSHRVRRFSAQSEFLLRYDYKNTNESEEIPKLKKKLEKREEIYLTPKNSRGFSASYATFISLQSFKSCKLLTEKVEWLDLSGVFTNISLKQIEDLLDPNKFPKLQRLSLANFSFDTSWHDGKEAKKSPKKYAKSSSDSSSSDSDSHYEKKKSSTKTSYKKKEEVEPMEVEVAKEAFPFYNDNITHLNLNGAYIGDYNESKFQSVLFRCRKLTTVILSYISRNLTQIVLQIPMHLHDLEVLDISYTKVKPEAILGLQSLKKLKTVYAVGHEISDLQVPFQVVNASLDELLAHRSSLTKHKNLITTPNLIIEQGYSLLHWAFSSDNYYKVLKSVLSLPNIDVNTKVSYSASNETQLFPPWVPIYPQPKPSQRQWYSFGGSRGGNVFHVALTFSKLTPKVIKLLIKKGANLNITSNQGVTPLSMAIICKNKEAVMELLKAGANVNTLDNDYLPIHHALSVSDDGDTDALAFLKSHGADLNAVSQDGLSLIDIACFRLLPQTLQFLFESGVRPSPHSRPFHQVVMGYANAPKNRSSSTTKKPLYKKDVKRRKSPVKRSDDGDSDENELVKASKIISILLQQGFSLTDQDETGSTAVHLAASRNDLLSILMETPSGKDAFQIQDSNGDTALHIHFRTQLDKAISSQIRGDVNVKNKEGATPLHILSYFFDSGTLADIVHVWFSEFKDINSRDNHGRTCLHLASINLHKEFFQFLITRGADVNALDNLGCTPGDYLLLSDQSYPSMMLQVLDKGLNVNAQSVIDGSTFLMNFVKIGKKLHTNIRELISKYKIDVNLSDHLGRTVLHHALKCGRLNWAKELIEVGADVNVSDSYGLTPLMLCYQNNLICNSFEYELHTEDYKPQIRKTKKHQSKILDITDLLAETIQILLERKVDLQKRDIHGNSVLHHACDLLTSASKSIPATFVDVTKKILSLSPSLLNMQNIEGETPLFLLSDMGDIKSGKKEKKYASSDSESEYYTSDSYSDSASYSSYKKEKEKPMKKPAEPMSPRITTTEAVSQVVTLMVALGADFNIKNYEKNGSIHNAFKNAQVNLLKLLIPHCDMNLQNGKGDACLHLLMKHLVMFNYIDFADLLDLIIQKGANINLQNQLGQTTLYLACNFGVYSSIEKLLTHGADPLIAEFSTKMVPVMRLCDTIKNSTKKNGLAALNKLLTACEYNCVDVLGNSVQDYLKPLRLDLASFLMEPVLSLQKLDNEEFKPSLPSYSAKRRGSPKTSTPFYKSTLLTTDSYNNLREIVQQNTRIANN